MVYSEHERSQIGRIKIAIGTIHLDLKTYRNKLEFYRNPELAITLLATMLSIE